MRPEGDDNNTNGASRPLSNGAGVSPLHKAAVSNVLNGTHKAMNGSSHTNGHNGSDTHNSRQSYHGHDREEVTRVLLQALSDLGYTGATGALSQESGFELESPIVAAFRNAVIQGEWAEAEDLLFGHSTGEGNTGLMLAEASDENMMRFCLREQKYLELLEERDTARALMVCSFLLGEYAPSTTGGIYSLHALSCLSSV
jgi:hypothetical protein